MSVYIQRRFNATIAVLNNDINKLQMLMLTLQNIRDAENIDFSLQNALIAFSDVADKTLEQVQKLVKSVGLKETKPEDLESDGFLSSEDSE